MPTTHQNIVSPFCPLLCDDLQVTEENGHLSVHSDSCALTAPMQLPPPENTPRIQGQAVTLDEAVQAAADILKKSHLPVFSGLGTDVDGMRAVLSLADYCGGAFDHHQSDLLMGRAIAIQHGGFMATTLSEVRNHADLILFVGNNISGAFQCFLQRTTKREATLREEQAAPPTIICLGEAPDMPGAEVLTVPQQQLTETLGAVSALLNGQPLQAAHIGQLSVAQLQTLVERLQNARYSVIAWQSGGLPALHTDILIDSLFELVKKLNEHTRCNAFPLGGKDGGTNVQQVSTWQTGYPMRVSFGERQPVYDPWRYNASRLLESDEADALLWVSAFQTPNPPTYELPTILLTGGPLPESFSRQPEVLIPIGTPGLDHGGHLFRADSVVALQVKKLRQTDLTSAATVLQKIEQALRS